MKIDLDVIIKKTVSPDDYIRNMEEPFRAAFFRRMDDYRIENASLDELQSAAGKYVIIAFSAGWCKDCVLNIPILDLIARATGLEVRVFGGLVRDPLNLNSKWRIPPSPVEVRTFGVDKIPVIIISRKDGKEIGRIIEHPRPGFTLEREIIGIIERDHL